MTMQNLITASNDWRGMGIGADNIWANYTIEGNLGVVSALNEMLIQSTENKIFALPALPAQWTRGGVSGLATRCGVEASVEWDRKKGFAALSLKARRALSVELILPESAKRFKIAKAESAPPENRTVKLDLTAKGLTVGIRF